MFANCENCGKYAQVDRYGCCKPCSEHEQSLISVAREYIRRHRKVSVSDLAETLQIESAQIQRWLQQGRLRAEPHRAICPVCRKQIVGGVFCDCTKEVKTISPDGYLAKSHGTPRRVQAKWEDYWTKESRIRRHAHRRLWLAAS